MGDRRGRKPGYERQRLAAELRTRGLSFRDIGQRLGVTRQGAQHLVRAAGASKARPFACATCGSTIRRDAVAGRCARCVAADPGSSLGERLQALRSVAGLTQRQLAARARVGVGIVQRCEGGLSSPQRRNLAALVAVLGPGLLPPGGAGL